MKALMLVVVLFSSIAAKADEFSEQEMWLEAAYYTTALIDYRQTVEITKNPDRWEETNMFLEEHPSRSDVNRHFILTSLIHWGISELLSGTDYMTTYQVTTITLNVYAIRNNAQIGITVSF